MSVLVGLSDAENRLRTFDLGKCFQHCLRANRFDSLPSSLFRSFGFYLATRSPMIRASEDSSRNIRTLVEQPAIALFSQLGYDTANCFYEKVGNITGSPLPVGGSLYRTSQSGENFLAPGPNLFHALDRS
ncbi:hypothetical protein Pla52n_32650 [Stieleria varia]|uniref:Uncharacterized protein n=1 Tax=Stieleria varia TaxID=2528005 RepID=A0A5C6AT15_9BACT|nr:hypothetical protein Pla52n_32650 [Stieleria varia]